jgi:HSP20 family molecular chaperone IbpA
MERFMDGFFCRQFRRYRPAGLNAVSPEIEMYDHKDEIVVKASVPGLDKPRSRLMQTL